jgi:hypothetical protein
MRFQSDLAAFGSILQIVSIDVCVNWWSNREDDNMAPFAGKNTACLQSHEQVLEDATTSTVVQRESMGDVTVNSRPTFCLVYATRCSQMLRPRFSQVDLMDQSGLDSAPVGPSISPCFIGSDSVVPTTVGRLSLGIHMKDAYLVLHKQMMPIASPHTQRFLTDTAHESGNPAFAKSNHPNLTIQAPIREIKPRIVPHQKKVTELSFSKPSPRRRRYRTARSGRPQTAARTTGLVDEPSRTISLCKIMGATV